MTAYQNKSSQAEREQVLRNDARVRSGSTFLDHTHSEEGGRFAKPQTIIGSDAVVQYPMAAPNWSVDPVGTEPPLGFDVNQIEAVGEKFEIEASCGDSEASARFSCASSPQQGDATEVSLEGMPQLASPTPLAGKASRAPRPIPPHQNGENHEANPSRDGEV